MSAFRFYFLKCHIETDNNYSGNPNIASQIIQYGLIAYKSMYQTKIHLNSSFLVGILINITIKTFWEQTRICPKKFMAFSLTLSFFYTMTIYNVYSHFSQLHNRGEIKMTEEIDILSKEAIKTDLALIKSCLGLINQTIIFSKERGETFSASENEELHMLVSKIDRNLNMVKESIEWKK